MILHMSQRLRLSDTLVFDAQLTGKLSERSISGQIEYWANLGRAIEPLLQGNQASALSKKAAVRPLSTCLESVDSPVGNRRVAKYLETQPFPHYEPTQDEPGLLVRIEANGTRTLGRFVNRQFQKVNARRK
jgi:hypothetical protein